MGYFSVNDDQFMRWTFWVSLHIITFALSWMPVWRRKWVAEKRMVWGKRHMWEEWLLFHPRWMYNGVLWSILFSLAGTAIYGVLDRDHEDSAREDVALWLHLWQITLAGLWPIIVFYWNMPFWAILYIAVCTALAGAVMGLYAAIDMVAFWYYLPYFIGLVLLTLVSAVLWVRVAYTRVEERKAGVSKMQWLQRFMGNPIRALVFNGFQPVYANEFMVYYADRKRLKWLVL